MRCQLKGQRQTQVSKIQVPRDKILDQVLVLIFDK